MRPRCCAIEMRSLALPQLSKQVRCIFPLTISTSFFSLILLFSASVLLHREIADQNGIVSLLGEYRTRCLFSKTFVLREAVQFKVRLMLTGQCYFLATFYVFIWLVC